MSERTPIQPMSVEDALKGFREANLRLASYAISSDLRSHDLVRDPAYAAMSNTADEYGRALELARLVQEPTQELPITDRSVA